MFNLHPTLAPETYPFAWMVDRWVGGGILEYDNIDAAAYVHEVTIENTDGGPYLRYESRIWLAAEPAEIVDKEESGTTTYAKLTKERLWSVTTGYLRVNPNVEKRADGSSAVEAMVASPAGNTQLWVGLINGPRLQMVTDAVARSASGAEFTSAKLMAGNVASDLFYAYDMEAFGSELRPYLAGRLSHTNATDVVLLGDDERPQDEDDQ
ncbi:FABP family protein [Arcanobacterium canis]